MKWWVALVALAVAGSALADPYPLYIRSPDGRDGFGEALAGGDFDGDDYADLAVGSPGSGKVHIYRGMRDEAFPDEGNALPGFEIEDESDDFGALLAAGDFDGDEIDDLAVGDGEGQVHILYGQLQIGWDVQVKRWEMWDFPDVEALYAVGDLDDDGASELVVVTRETVDCGCGLDGDRDGEAEFGRVWVVYGGEAGAAPFAVEVGLPDVEWCGCAPVDGDLCERDCEVGAAVIGPSTSSVEGRFIAIGAPGVEATGRVWVYRNAGDDWLAEPTEDVTGYAGSQVDGTRVGGALAKLDGALLANAGATLLTSGTPNTLRTYTSMCVGYTEVGRAFERWLPLVEEPVFAVGPLREDVEPKLFVVDAAADDEGRLYLYDEAANISQPPTQVVVGDDDNGYIRAPVVVVGEMNSPAPELRFGVEAAARLVDPPGVLLLVDGVPLGADRDRDALVDGFDPCPAAGALERLDTDYDGVPDACDCASPAPRADLDCDPRDFALLAVGADAMCLDEGDPNAAAYADLREILTRKGHPALLAVEGLAQPDALDVVVLVGDTPLRDDHQCAIERFVDAGGSALDLRRTEEALGGIEGRIPAPEGMGALSAAALCSPEGAVSEALCEGLANVPYEGGMTAGLDPTGQVFLRTLDGRAMGVVQREGAGRIIVLGSGGFEHDEPICGRSGVLDTRPARRLMANVIDALTEPRAEPIAPADTEACYGGPAVTVAEADLYHELAPFEEVEVAFTMFDVATPAHGLATEAFLDPDRGYVTVAVEHEDGLGTLTISAMGRPGRVVVELKGIDGDGESGEALIVVDVVCDDSDGDGLCDDVDDADGDGVADEDDNCLVVPNPGQDDTDLDGVGDACDDCDDIDEDGACGPGDNCPFDPNDAQVDSDGDGRGDVCDSCPVTPDDGSDGDGDGIGDACDVCPHVPDADQPDEDGDGIGDACVGDADGDLLSDARERELGTDPNDPDSDGDGFDDFAEVEFYDTDPLAHDDDSDGDGWPDAADRCPFVPNPGQEDGDGDGVGDHCDLGDGGGEGDEDIQGLQLGGDGCRAAPGRGEGAWWWLLVLGVGVTRRRGGASVGR